MQGLCFEIFKGGDGEALRKQSTNYSFRVCFSLREFFVPTVPKCYVIKQLN